MRSGALARCLAGLLAGDGRPAGERRALVQLMVMLATLPPPPDPLGLMPRYGELRETFLAAAGGDDGELAEQAFLELYCHLHGHEAPYTRDERHLVSSSGGYWCHAGGLSPVVKALPWVRPATVSADYGAGNGLQLLLLQRLAPHARTVQIEISSAMIEAGRALQCWLGVPTARVEWINDDVRNVPARGFDIVYLYRPLRPQGAGRCFYQGLARDLAGAEGGVVVLSIADCLRPFLPATFQRLYYDGHLACYRKRTGGPAQVDHA